MKNVYSVTLRIAGGKMYGYSVLAADSITDADGADSALTKARAKCLADHGESGVMQSISTLAENVLE